MKGLNIAITTLSLSMLCGCFTFNQSEFPLVETTKVPAGKDIKVQLAGFEAMVTTYVPVYGYETVMHAVPGSGPHHHHHGLVATTYATETYVPHESATGVFIDRATEELEKAGFMLRTESPDYRIEVKFSGPIITDSDRCKEAAWTILTLLTADYGVQTWTAKLKIYSVADERLVFFNDYSEEYHAIVWGPLPIFSPGGSDKTSYNMMQSWCLTALTDRAIADASAFLTTL